MRSDLLPLIWEPREDLAVEYKGWLDLSQEKGKATLAKACIALANHGGGFLVLGFEEEGDSLESIPRPDHDNDITQDAINSVIRRYADPAFHCQLHMIPHPVTEVDHPVIVVPSDLSVPVISKRTCQDTIQQHRCYIRKSGPRSEEPQTAEEWRILLRRCVLASREDMLSAIRAIVLGNAKTGIETPDSREELKGFRATSFEKWRELTNHLNPDSPECFPHGYYQVSIQPVGSSSAGTLQVLKDWLSHARLIKLTGSDPFPDKNREPWRPQPIDDHIEAWLGQRTDENIPRESMYSDYWRASRKGQLYTIRGYTEDSLEERRNVQPGTVFDVGLPVWRIGEVLYFASRFFEKFEGVQTVIINCRFTRLTGRTLTSIDYRRDVWTRACSSDKIESNTSVTPRQLEENMVEVVHQLLTPFYEAFDFFVLTRQLVEEELERLRKGRF